MLYRLIMKIKIYSVWKSGSSFVRRFFKEVSKLSSLSYVELHDEDEKKVLPKNNYCSCPYREGPIESSVNQKDILHLILLRDPRDMLVSLYYSMGYLHNYGKQTSKVHDSVNKIDINSFVLSKMCNVVSRLNSYMKYENYSNVVFLSYEDMILDFSNWAYKVCSYFNLKEEDKEKVVRLFENEFKNIKELTIDEMKQGIKRHNRKMLPGDYKEKLNEDTINKLNKHCKDVILFIRRVSGQKLL